VFWKQTYEAPGKFFLKTYQVADLLVDVLAERKDLECLNGVLRKLISSVRFDVLWWHQVAIKAYIIFTLLLKKQVKELLPGDDWWSLHNAFPKRTFAKIFTKIERMIHEQLRDDNVPDVTGEDDRMELSLSNKPTLFTTAIPSSGPILILLKRACDVRRLPDIPANKVDNVVTEEGDQTAKDYDIAQSTLDNLSIQLYSYLFVVKGIAESLIARSISTDTTDVNALLASDRHMLDACRWFLDMARVYFPHDTNSPLLVPISTIEERLKQKTPTESDVTDAQPTTSDPVSASYLLGKISAFCRNLRSRQKNVEENKEDTAAEGVTNEQSITVEPENDSAIQEVLPAYSTENEAPAQEVPSAYATENEASIHEAPNIRATEHEAMIHEASFTNATENETDVYETPSMFTNVHRPAIHQASSAHLTDHEDNMISANAIHVADMKISPVHEDTLSNVKTTNPEEAGYEGMHDRIHSAARRTELPSFTFSNQQFNLTSSNHVSPVASPIVFFAPPIHQEPLQRRDSLSSAIMNFFNLGRRIASVYSQETSPDYDEFRPEED
jgi:hypothetical protein